VKSESGLKQSLEGMKQSTENLNTKWITTNPQEEKTGMIPKSVSAAEWMILVIPQMIPLQLPVPQYHQEFNLNLKHKIKWEIYYISLP
jgi:hypothetical protein